MLRDPRVEGAGRQLRQRSGSACARPTSWLPDPEHLSRVRREPARRVSAGDGALPRSQLRDDRSILDLLSANYSFVNERLAQHYGIAGRLRRALPQSDVHRRRARRPARPGRHPDGDVVSGPHGAGAARLLGARKPARHAAAAAAARCPRSGTDERRRPRRCRSASRWKCIARTRRARSATCAWIRSASRWRTSTRSAAGARAATGCRWTRRPSSPTARRIDGVQGLRQFLLSTADSYVDTFVAKLLTYALGRHVDYRDQPAIRAHRARRGGRRLPLVGHHSRHRQEHAVPDEEDRVMMITKKALSRRTVLKALGATVPLPFLDAMVPALTALRQTPAQPALRFGAVYVPNGVIPGQVVSDRRGRGVRVLADAEAARAVSRSAARDQRPRQRAAAAAGRASVQQSRGREHALPDRRHAKPQPARRRVDRSDRGEGAEPGHVAAVARARAGIGGFRHVVRLRPQLRLHRHDCVGAARRRRCRWSTIPSAAFVRLFGDGASSDAAARRARMQQQRQHSRFAARRGGQPAQQGGRRPIARGSRGYLDSVRDVERRIQKAVAHNTEMPRVRSSGRRSRHVRAARQADVRPAAARLPGRRDARRHVHARAASSAAAPIRRSACRMRIIRSRITSAIRCAWRSARRSITTTCRCSRSSSRR